MVVDCIGLLIYLRVENMKRDRAARAGNHRHTVDEGLTDVTDLKNPAFRYVY